MSTYEVAMALFWSQGRPSPPHCRILGVADHHQSASTIILVVLSLLLLPHKSKCLFKTIFMKRRGSRRKFCTYNDGVTAPPGGRIG